jgi:hypothetical protein
LAQVAEHVIFTEKKGREEKERGREKSEREDY